MTFTPKQLFQLQTVEGLAAVVAKGHAPAMQIDQGAVQGRMQLLPIHQAFFNEDIADRHHWNQALLLKPGQALDSNVLDRALQALLAHHDALRVSFQQEDGSTWSACYRQIGEPARRLACGKRNFSTRPNCRRCATRRNAASICSKGHCCEPCWQTCPTVTSGYCW